MKKALKVVGLYLLFGAIIAITISVFGGYEDLLINKTMGNMSILGYMILMLTIIAFWLPSLVFILFSKNIYLTFAYTKPILVAVIAVFILLSVYIVKHSNKKQV